MKWFKVLGLGLWLWGCSSNSPQKHLTLWTAFEGQELIALQAICREAPQPLDILAVPFDQLKKKVLVSTPAGQGPDLIVGPQDWLGVFSVAQLLEPLPRDQVEQLQEQVSPVALEGVTCQGDCYAYPILLDALALLRNPRLAPRSPKDLAELRAYALELQKDGIKGFYFVLRELYFSWPFFSAYGATFFGPGLQPGMTGPEGEQACLYLKSLRQAGLIPVGAKNDFAKSQFLEQTLAMTLNGPWFLGDLRNQRVPYVIEPVPPGPQKSASFVGVTGLMVNRLSLRKQQALQLLPWLASSHSQVRLALASGRVPALRQAQRLAAQDPQRGSDIRAFTQVVEQGVAMPNHPAGNAIWEPIRQALELISKGEAEARQELTRADSQIRDKIQRMVE